MIEINIVSKVNVSITEEQLKQIIIEKAKELRPDVVINEVSFSGSKGNIKIDIDADLIGEPEPDYLADLESRIEVVEEEELKPIKPEPVKKPDVLAQYMCSSKDTSTQTFDEVLSDLLTGSEIDEEDVIDKPIHRTPTLDLT